MSDNKKAPLDSETILMTLDQLGQTVDIMTSVVGRLRGYITEQLGSIEPLSSNEQLNSNEKNSTDSQSRNHFPDSTSQTVH